MNILRETNPKILNGILQDFLDTSVLMTRTDRQMLVLAGGACRSFVTAETPTDFDLFIVGEDSSGELKFDVISNLDKLYPRVFTCPEGLLYSWKALYGKIQLITPGTYRNLHELLDTFDFTLCQAGLIWFPLGGYNLYYTPEFWSDVTHKKLTLVNVSYPLATMNRIYKYKGYGYKVGKAQEDFIRQIYEREFSDESLYRHYID